ncbi:hypothetical protein [Ensifer sp. ENS12]|uniref:hypothetical protein n=1 Tax=Ensifer sp. ENS12 TaxID=2854774 RepID=UPI002103302F|nr:hypothetical protein [Ensifer sp. ENS12]
MTIATRPDRQPTQMQTAPTAMRSAVGSVETRDRRTPTKPIAAAKARRFVDDIASIEALQALQTLQPAKMRRSYKANLGLKTYALAQMESFGGRSSPT